jgi:2-haloacid dehalogenase
MVELLVFDVNETLLSLHPLRRRFEATYGEAVSLGEWFARMLHGSLLANALDQYRPFDVIGAEALQRLAGRAGHDITMDEARIAVEPLATAPPHPDVVPALSRLAESGQRMIALTNGSTDVANIQVDSAGLRDYLERVISVEEVGRFKPDPTPYRYAADQMGLDMDQMMLVASHDWDCAGAMNAGAQAAFVARSGVTWGLPSEPPHLIVADLGELADRVV